MAFADVGNLGAGGNTNNNQATLTVATVLALAAGDLAVVAVTVDNRNATGGDQLDVSGVTIGGIAMQKAVQHAQAVTAQTGAATSLWYLNVTSTIASGANIIATFTTATTSDATALSARKYSKAAGMNAALDGTSIGVSTTTAPPSLDVTTPNEERLRIRACGCEYDSTLTFTPTGSWTGWTEGASAASGTITEVVIEAEHRIVTGTNGASAPTLSAACDAASVYAAFKEVLAPTNQDSMFMVM